MRHHPDTCPNCGGELEFSNFDAESGALVQRWACTFCDSEGHDWYQPTSRVVTFFNGNQISETLESVDSDRPVRGVLSSNFNTTDCERPFYVDTGLPVYPEVTCDELGVGSIRVHWPDNDSEAVDILTVRTTGTTLDAEPFDEQPVED